MQLSLDGMIKELDCRLNILEEKLQRGYNKEMEEEFLITKSELDCWEKGRKLRLLKLQIKYG